MGSKVFSVVSVSEERGRSCDVLHPLLHSWREAPDEPTANDC